MRFDVISCRQYNIKTIKHLFEDLAKLLEFYPKNQIGMIREGLKQVFEFSQGMKTMISSLKLKERK